MIIIFSLFGKIIVYIIGVVLLFLVCLAFAGYNYIHTKGRTRLLIIIISIVIAALPVIAGYSLDYYAKSMAPSDSDSLMACIYKGSYDGYYIFELKSYRTAENYAVPDSVETPLLFKEGCDCFLYLTKEYPENDETKMELPESFELSFGHSTAQVLDEDVVITGDYIYTSFELMLVALLVIMVFHIFVIFYMSKRVKDEKALDNVDDNMR